MKKKMILVTHGFPFGESERSFLCEEIKQLESSFELTVLAIEQAGAVSNLRHSLSGRFRTVRFRFKGKVAPRRAFRVLRDRDAAGELVSYLSEPKLMKKVLGYAARATAIEEVLERIVDKYGADIIYTFWCTEEAYAALRMKKKHPEIKVMSRLHGCDLFKERTGYGIQPLHSCIADKADLLVFVSKRGEEYFRREFPGRADTAVSYLGAAGFGCLPADREDSFVIVSCSNVIPLKRVERIAEALALVRSVSLRWIHIGDGESICAVSDSAEELLKGTGHTAEFIGAVPNEMIGKLYHNCCPDLFVSASSSEGGCPVSIAEAFSCGIPAVGTDVGGTSELIADGCSGFVISSDAQAPELAAAIEKFYALSRSERIQMRKNAYETFKRSFDAKNNAERMITVIQSKLMIGGQRYKRK